MTKRAATFFTAALGTVPQSVPISRDVHSPGRDGVRAGGLADRLAATSGLGEFKMGHSGRSWGVAAGVGFLVGGA